MESQQNYLSLYSSAYLQYCVSVVYLILLHIQFYLESLRGPDRMVVGFAAPCAISTCHHLSCEFESHSWRGVLNTTLFDKVSQPVTSN